MGGRFGRRICRAGPANLHAGKSRFACPAMFLFMGGDQVGSLDRLLGLAWSGRIHAVPRCFNKDKMRSRLLAGTWVI